MLRNVLLSLLSLALASCAGEHPGPLAGTWVATEPFPITVTFRDGESEAMGMTRPVSYRIDGNEVFVTYTEGPRKGATFHYRVIDANTIRSESGILRRVR